MRIPIVSRLLAVIILLGATRLASANLIINPGFETGDFTGWTTTPAASGSAFGVGFIAHSGSYAADFGAIGSGLDTISQTFATTPGAFYDISFWLLNDNSNMPPDNNFEAAFGTLGLYTAFNAPDFPYTQFTFLAFPATDSSTTLSFAGRNKPGIFFLDDVSVTLSASTRVPDAGSSAPLLGVALGGLIFLQRRLGRSPVGNQRA